MNTKEEIEKTENKLNETNLNDLPISEEQANSTTGGGERYDDCIQVLSFNFGVTQSGSR